MSDQPVSGDRPNTLSRRTFLRAAGVAGGAALGPAVLRRKAEAQETRLKAEAAVSALIGVVVVRGTGSFDTLPSADVAEVAALLTQLVESVLGD